LRWILSPRQSLSRRLEEDLELWEAEKLSLAEVRSRNPDVDVGAIANVHARLSAIASQQPPHPNRIWYLIERSLAPGQIRRTGWVLAALLVGAAVAASVTATLRRLRDYGDGPT
jgi:hypothetical protein